MRTTTLLALVAITSTLGAAIGANLDVNDNHRPVAGWWSPTMGTADDTPVARTADEVNASADSSAVLVNSGRVLCYECTDDEAEQVANFVYDAGPYVPTRVPEGVEDVCYIGGPEDIRYLPIDNFTELYDAARWSCQKAPEIFPVAALDLKPSTMKNVEYVALTQGELKKLHDAAMFGDEYGPFEVADICMGPSVHVPDEWFKKDE